MTHPSASSAALRTPSAHQLCVDEMLSAVRRETATAKPSIFKPAPPKPQPSSRLLDHRIAEELEYIVRKLEHLGSVLSDDPILIVRHSMALQSIDLMKQLLGQLARVIAAHDKEAVTDQLTLTELKGRLQRKGIGLPANETEVPRSLQE